MGYAFAVASCGVKQKIVQSLQMMDAFLADLKYVAGKPAIAGGRLVIIAPATDWRPARERRDCA